MKELIDVKNRLNWHVEQTDARDNIRCYRAIFEATITHDIDFYIGYRVFMDNSNEWYLGIIQTAPNIDANPITIKCYTPEIGKKMAEDELQKIFDGMKKLLDN